MCSNFLLSAAPKQIQGHLFWLEAENPYDVLYTRSLFAFSMRPLHLQTVTLPFCFSLLTGSQFSVGTEMYCHLWTMHISMCYMEASPCKHRSLLYSCFHSSVQQSTFSRSKSAKNTAWWYLETEKYALPDASNIYLRMGSWSVYHWSCQLAGDTVQHTNCSS